MIKDKIIKVTKPLSNKYKYINDWIAIKITKQNYDPFYPPYLSTLHSVGALTVTDVTIGVNVYDDLVYLFLHCDVSLSVFLLDLSDMLKHKTDPSEKNLFCGLTCLTSLQQADHSRSPVFSVPSSMSVSTLVWYPPVQTHSPNYIRNMSMNTGQIPTCSDTLIALPRNMSMKTGLIPTCSDTLTPLT